MVSIKVRCDWCSKKFNRLGLTKKQLDDYGYYIRGHRGYHLCTPECKKRLVACLTEKP